MPDAETDHAVDPNQDDIDYFHQIEALIPWNPIIDDDSALIAAYALMELVARRTPDALGDGLAELHALTSLIHQLNDWIASTIEDARRHHHTNRHILAQLSATPTRADNAAYSADDTPNPDPHWTDTTPRRRHVYDGKTLTAQELSADDSR